MELNKLHSRAASVAGSTCTSTGTSSYLPASTSASPCSPGGTQPASRGAAGHGGWRQRSRGRRGHRCSCGHGGAPRCPHRCHCTQSCCGEGRAHGRSGSQSSRLQDGPPKHGCMKANNPRQHHVPKQQHGMQDFTSPPLPPRPRCCWKRAALPPLRLPRTRSCCAWSPAAACRALPAATQRTAEAASWWASRAMKNACMTRGNG